MAEYGMIIIKRTIDKFVEAGDNMIFLKAR